VRQLSSFVIAAFVAASLVVVCAVAVGATKPPAHKVIICHATGAKTNPYVVESVDVASIESFAGGASGHAASGINVGDIIPPFVYGSFSYAGNNWTAEGQDIYSDGCKIVDDDKGGTLSPSASPTSNPTRTPAIEKPPTVTQDPPQAATQNISPTAAKNSPKPPTTGVQ